MHGMFKSQALAPHLASVRRYAHALTECPERADAIIVIALESLMESRSPAAPATADARLALFRAFHAARAVVGLADCSRSAIGGGAQDDRLEWATFLLASMEGFTPHETAIITGRPLPAVNATLSRWLNAAASSGYFGSIKDPTNTAGRGNVAAWIAEIERALRLGAS
jgi:hypothetical protein